MNEPQRLATFRQLRTAAESVRKGKGNALSRMRRLWAEFPETQNEPCPSAAEVLAHCERVEREAELDRQFEEGLKT